MRAIPEDIMAYARELWRQGGSVEASPPLAIAHAILVERERCAKIADVWAAEGEDDYLEPEYSSGQHVTARFIADAIRMREFQL